MWYHLLKQNFIIFAENKRGENGNIADTQDEATELTGSNKMEQ
jgi:hypothetical protein